MPDLTDLPVEQIYDYQKRALFRLHLFFTGQTHRLWNDWLDSARAILLRHAGEGGVIETINLFAVTRELSDNWTATLRAWEKLFEEARYQAAALPYGALARQHYHYLSLLEVAESRRLTESGEFATPFEGQLQAAMNWAANKQYADGVNLSRRVWRLEEDSKREIVQIVNAGIANGTSAWDLSKELEGYLGAGQDCPRWTGTRLFKLTKRQISQGDLTGLISGHPCGSQGVAYKALRLARTEFQVVHNKASCDIMAASPWVTGIAVNLNPQHPKQDECDDYTAGSPYRKNEVPLPPYHSHCLCYLTGVLMKDADFTRQMQDWLNSRPAWPEMSAYQEWAGASLADLLTPALLLAGGMVLMRWLYGNEEELAAPFEAETAALGAVEL